MLHSSHGNPANFLGLRFYGFLLGVLERSSTPEALHGRPTGVKPRAFRQQRIERRVGAQPSGLCRARVRNTLPGRIALGGTAAPPLIA